MWSILPVVVSVLCCLIPIYQAAPMLDLIEKLPGLSKQPTFKQYSGYLKGDDKDDKYLHYWFVESSSNPSTDPVVLWLTGGPGCSSDMALLTENGPFRVHANGSLTYNPYSWNQAANIIYLESPVMVGYSFAHSGVFKTNDTVVAVQNAYAMNDFFKHFPEYKDNDFYIVGESYAGVYVPTLASELIDMFPNIKFKGFGIGNGLSSFPDNDNSAAYFAYYHGLIGDSRWDFLMENCCPDNNPKRCNFTSAALTKQECKSQMAEISKLIWASGLDVYNLYSECKGSSNTGFSTLYRPDERVFESSYFGWPFSYLDTPQMEMEKRKLIPSGKLRMGPPCVDFTDVTTYMNERKVREALHISPFAGEWAGCSGEVNAGYDKLYPTMHSFYEKALDHKLRIMIYNGDVDMACNFMMEEWFVDRLPLKNRSDRKMWYYKAEDKSKQVAGFFTKYDQLTLVTVKGAGHMVPTDKPIQALELFVNFIQDKPFME